MAPRNPFPGMNPFLEQRWKDFHAGFIIALRTKLNRLLPADLVARAEVGLYVTSDGHERPIAPDTFVVELNDTPPMTASDSGGTTAIAPQPVIVRIRPEPVTIRRIEIREAEGNDRVVTVIEVFSPTNKSDSKGRRQYRRKRSEYLAAGVNLVEIDLLRGGRHLLYAPPALIPVKVRKAYKVCVVRRTFDGAASDPREVDCELYGADLDEPLPSINVPLRPLDRDVVLPLQSLMELAFEDGRYIDLRYDREPDPPFNEAERAVVRERLTRLPPK